MRKTLPALLAVLVSVLAVCMPGTSSAAEQGPGGLGIMVAQLYDRGVENRLGDLVVLYVKPGSPAARAGIRRGDLIVEIDGKPVAGREYADITAELRGPIGSSAALTIMKPSEKKTTRITLKRAQTASPPREKTRP